VETKVEGLIIVNPSSHISIHKTKVEFWYSNKWI